jgi:hypothetical protein
MCCLCNASVRCMRCCAFVNALVCYCVCAPFACDCVCVRMLCVWYIEFLMSVCNGRMLWVCVTCGFIMNVSESAMRERNAIVCLCEFVRVHVSAGSCVVLQGVVILVRVRVASSRRFWDVWMWLMCMAPCVVLVCVASVSVLPGYVRWCVGILVCYRCVCVYYNLCFSVCDCVLGRVYVLARMFVVRVCCLCGCVGGICMVPASLCLFRVWTVCAWNVGVRLGVRCAYDACVFRVYVACVMRPWGAWLVVRS